MDSSKILAIVRQLLSRMVSDQVTEAEIKIKELSKNQVQYWPIIYSILSSPQQIQHIKTMAASFINQHFIIELSIQKVVEIKNTLFQILSNPSITNLDKRIFQKSLIKCLQLLAEGNLLLTDQLLQLINQTLTNNNSFETATLIIQCLAEAVIPVQFIQQAISQSYESIVNFLLGAENMNFVNQMLNMWILVFEKLKGNSKMRHLLQNMFKSQQLQHLLVMIYQLKAQAETIVCLSQNAIEVNILKTNATELNKIVMQMQTLKPGPFLKVILEFTQPFLAKLANTLRILAGKRELIQKTKSEDLMINLLAIIRFYIRMKPDVFGLQDALNFQNEIIFDLLAIDQAEVLIFNQNPSEFHSLALDCCEGQNSGVLKTETMKFLECLGDNIDGSLNYSLARSVQSLRQKLGYPLKSEFAGLKPLYVQTAALVMSLFSYKFLGYAQQIQEISIILQDERIKCLTPLELARIFTLLGYGYKQFCKYGLAPQKWISFAISYHEHNTTRYCALDFLVDLLDELFNQSFLIDVTEIMESETIPIIWKIVGKIVSKHYFALQDSHLALIISKLILRIQKQLQLVKQNEKTHSSDIISCFDIAIAILKQQKADTKCNHQKRNFLISTTSPLLEYYQKTVQIINDDDEVVKLATEMVNLSDVLMPFTAYYTNEFITQFRGQKIKYVDKSYVRYFNQVLIKGDFQRDRAQLIQIAKVLIDTLSVYSDKLIDGKKKKLKPFHTHRLMLSNVLIVVQNLIALHGIYLLNLEDFNFIKKITQICVKLLPDKRAQNIQRTASANIIHSRVLNTLFLCHLHQNNSQTFDYFQRFKNENIYHDYDTKVLIMSVEKLIFNESELNSVVYLLCLLKKIVQDSENKDIAIQKIKIKPSKQEKKQQQLKKVNQFDKILQKIDSPFKTDKISYLLLVQLFLNLKKANIQTFNTLLGAFPIQVFHYYDKYLNFEQLQKKQRIYRKVVGIKMDWANQHHSNIDITKQDDSDEEQSNITYRQILKRQRIKIKDGLKKKYSIKNEKKKLHYE